MMKQRPGSRSLLALAMLCLALLLSQFGTAIAQEPNKVALVVDFGDGRYVTRCVEFVEDEITGEEVLKRSGLNVIFEYSSTGAAVCKIEDVGCDFPSEPCFCDCQGSDCVYWSYWYVENGKWVYASEGAAGRTVRDGDMEGWAWGSGAVGTSGRQPVWMPFLNICVPPTVTPTPSLTPTETPIPTETAMPTLTFTPLPTTATPTRTTTPTRTPTRTRTPPPTNTPRPTSALASPTPGPTRTLPAVPPRIPTPTHGAAYPAPPTQPPAHTATPTQVPTLPPAPTQGPAYPPPPTAPPGAAGGVTPTATSTVSTEVTLEATAVLVTVPPPSSVIETPERAPVVGRDELAGREPIPTRMPRKKPSIPPPLTPQASKGSGPGIPWEYIFLGVIVAALVAGLFIIRSRRRARQAGENTP